MNIKLFKIYAISIQRKTEHIVTFLHLLNLIHNASSMVNIKLSYFLIDMFTNMKHHGILMSIISALVEEPMDLNT